METQTFSFTSGENTYNYNISENVVIHIDKISNSVAFLYFTNKSNEKINIPSGLVVYEYDFQTNEKVMLKPIQQHFVLSWTDNYTIEYVFENKTIVILDIKNERNWTITR
jgi:hypothetical protein